MVWRANGPQGNESGKIKWELVRWTRGRGLDLGCGVYKTFPHFIGVDNGKDAVLFGHPINPDIRVSTAAELPMFASGSMDFVFSSHLLEHFPLTPDDPRKWPNPIARAMAEKMLLEKRTALEALKEWLRVLKVNGYLVLYVPDEDQYPKVGMPGANPDHAWNCNYSAIVDLMDQTRTGYDLVDYQVRSAGDEYSLFFVFQKQSGSVRRFSYRKWETEAKGKRCGLVRYGAYGDLLQCSSVAAGLKDLGYHVTIYTSPPGEEVIKHDPNIDEFFFQDKDQVPNHLLGEFWTYESKKYDKWVNLSESVECNMLAVPGKATHWWSPQARHRYMNHNYLEMQHAIAGVPHIPRVKFFATEEEQAWAKKERKQLGGAPLILWSLNGSSIHKTWGGLDSTIASIMLEYPTAHVVLVGAPDSAILEAGWESEPRVHCRAGKYTIRQTMALLEHVEVMIGPETGVMNAGSQLPNAKVVFLSHSTHENLTRDWTNTFAIASGNTVCPGRGINEAPACHQMHYGWEHCKQFRKEGDPRDGTAQCQADIDGRGAWDIIRQAISQSIFHQAPDPATLVFAPDWI